MSMILFSKHTPTSILFYTYASSSSAMSLSNRSLVSLARRLQQRLEVRPMAVVMLPAGILPSMRVAA